METKENSVSYPRNCEKLVMRVAEDMSGLINDLAYKNGVSKSFMVRRLIEIGSRHLDEFRFII